jgi:hypothetical protein
MPYYDYIDIKTEKEVTVLRSFKEYETVPDKEEATKAGLTEEEYEAAEWERRIKAGGKSIGFGLKGYW